MWHFVHISTPNILSTKKARGPGHAPKKRRELHSKKKECSQENRSVPKKSFRLPLLRVRQTPFSRPRCRYCTGHTHTSGTFLCLQHLLSPHRAAFLPRFPWFSVCITNFRAFLLFVAGAACIGNRLYLQRFIFCARSADRDRICALFSTLPPNLSLFTAFSASNGEQPAECLRLFQVILIDVSRETRILLAIFSIIRAVHYSS